MDTSGLPFESVWSPRILLVDDEPSTLDCLAEALSSTGVEVLTARSGPDALRVAMHCTHLSAALIDVVLPGMSGFEIAARLRQRPCLANMPMLFLTGVALERGHLELGFELGAVDYLIKPVDLAALRGKIRTFVRMSEQQERERLNLARSRVTDLRSRQQMMLELDRLRAREREHEVAVQLGASTLIARLRNRLRLLLRRATDTEAQEQKALLDDLRDLSALLDDSLALVEQPLRPLPLNELIRGCMELHAHEFETHGVHVVATLPEPSPMVMADPDRLAPALRQLCGYGVESMPTGGRLQVSVSSSEHEALLYIRSSGEARTPAASTGAPELRLSLAREVIEALRGRLATRSVSGSIELEAALPLLASSAVPMP